MAVRLTRHAAHHSAEQKEQQLQLPAAVVTLAATLSQAGAADAGAHPPCRTCHWHPSPLLAGRLIAWRVERRQSPQSPAALSGALAHASEAWHPL